MSQQPPTPPPTPPPGFYPYPPQQPPRKKHTARTVLITLSAVFVVLVGGITGCTVLVMGGGNGNDTGHTQVQASDDGGTRGRAAEKAKKGQAAKPTHDSTKYGYWYDAKKDVAVDGLAAGSFDDQYVAFSITNQSDTKLDYTVTFGYYNAQGERIGEDYAYVDSVNPGEKVRATEYDTMVEPGTKTAKVLSADATAS